ncbi:energy transducer TonB [Hymenobacter sp. BT683]|uniref:Energy transducer TonB n=1 Tax=Hymenobacter jeongseonensis TaxID=2791027 RepID=A0ABS0IC06_9BACT|nr:energy transducer TonB [Hymenobacter jeongseonensis]MBF9235882.1 energy transducer TonB [Hymenobacter jeongseonensis]
MSPADSPFAPLPASGPHPATDELRAYATGTLAHAEQHRIEAHTLDCERCADLVEGFSMSDAPTTDQAVATLRARLQARTGTPQPVPLATRWAWPRLAAAAALLGGIAGGIWSLEQRDPDPVAKARLEAPQPIAAAPPQTSAEPALEQASAPDAADAGASKTAASADYAAVTTAPPPSAARSATQRRAGRAAKRIRMADKEVKADYAMVPESSEAKQSVLQQANEDNAPASMAAAPAVPNLDEVQAQESAADTLATLRSEAVASQSAKAKAVETAPMAANSAAARVANTPMPAAPSIKPAPVGGSVALREYLRSEAAAFEPETPAIRLTGTVRLKFVVGADGKLSDLKVTRGLRADYDAEALRIVCDGPAWQPGISGGRRAPLPMELTVPF